MMRYVHYCLRLYGLPLSAIIGSLIVAILVFEGASNSTSRFDTSQPTGSQGLSGIPTDRASLVYWSTYIFLARIDSFDGVGTLPDNPGSAPRNYYSATITERIKGDIPDKVRIGQEGGDVLFEGDFMLKQGNEYLIMASNTADIGFYQITVPGGMAQITIADSKQRAALVDEFRRLANVSVPTPTSETSPVTVTEVVGPASTATSTSGPTSTDTPVPSVTATETQQGSPVASPIVYELHS